MYKKKVKKKNYPVHDFVKVKNHTKKKIKKKKKMKINHSTIYNPNTNYYLKYL